MRTVKEEMDIDIQEENLDRTHRVDNPKVCKEGKPKPIIIKFARYDLIVMMCVVQCIKIKRSLKVKSF